MPTPGAPFLIMLMAVLLLSSLQGESLITNETGVYENATGQWIVNETPVEEELLVAGREYSNIEDAIALLRNVTAQAPEGDQISLTSGQEGPASWTANGSAPEVSWETNLSKPAEGVYSEIDAAVNGSKGKKYLVVSKQGDSVDIVTGKGKKIALDEGIFDEIAANRSARAIVKMGNGKFTYVELSEDKLPELADSGAVEIYNDPPVSALLSDSLEIIGASHVHDELGLTGKGVAICIVDTGVDYSEVPNAVEGYDFVNNDTDASDDNGHGTFMALVIQAIAPDATIRGICAEITKIGGWLVWSLISYLRFLGFAGEASSCP